MLLPVNGLVSVRYPVLPKGRPDRQNACKDMPIVQKKSFRATVVVLIVYM